ncbi:MAG: NUDIX hydrolase [Alphaproteobacteria bacterium]|nr:NUDIX hydrolase [Alphaproteobacteria bacterium]
MTDSKDGQPAARSPIPSSTILLLRDGPAGLEVFMVKRHREVDFASGALVFPGGKVDRRDADPDLLERARTAMPETDEEELCFRIAAIREAFEECAILLCRRGGRLIGATEADDIAARHRDRLNAGAIGFGDIVRAEDLVPACDLLVPFARWVTPVNLPKRFDTWFYLAAAPEDQVTAHDGREAVDSVWISPLALLREAEAKRATVVFATRMNLAKLGRSATVPAAMAAARADRIVTVMPEFGETPAGPVLRIPLEAGYGVSEVVVKDIPRP